MARPLKQGVDYFPLDVHLDDKFKFIQIKYGLEGFAIIIKLLQQIYSCGYWYQWGEDEQLIFKNENHVSCETLNGVMSEALKREIFSQEMLDKYQILTSSGIQKRYKEIVRRRKDIKIITEYLVIDDIYPVIDDTMPTPCQHDDDNNTQRKGKRKETETTKKKETSKPDPIPYQEIVDLYNEICVDAIKCIKLTDSRKKQIALRYKELGGIELFEKAFHLVQGSSFLTGKNDRNWKVDIPWLTQNDSNIIKVLEGKYKNDKPSTQTERKTRVVQESDDEWLI